MLPALKSLDDIQTVSSVTIRSTLGRILASPHFRTSKRCVDFLTYIVEAALDGRADTLKERTLAIEVFGRAPTWDSGNDTIVRGGAREVRKRLAQYYSSSEGVQDKIRIDVPPGSYVPSFVVPDSARLDIDLSPGSSTQKPVTKTRKMLWMRGISAALLTMAVLAILTKAVLPSFSDSRRFWSPLWESRSPVTILLPYQIEIRSTGETGMEDFGAFQTVSDSSPVSSSNHFISYGAVAAATRISNLLGRHSRDARVRAVSSVNFADLQGAPSVLIGSSTDRWMMEFPLRLRYRLGYDGKNEAAILDSADRSRHWNVPPLDSSEDYFLVCRMPAPSSGKPVLVAAGLTQLGAEAAGEFLTDLERLDQILAQINGNWQKQNLELVIHTKSMGQSQRTFDLVAWQTSK